MSRRKDEITRRQVMGVGLVSGTAIAAGAGLTSGCVDSRSHTFTLNLDDKLLSVDDIRAEAIGNTLVGTLYDGERYELYLRPDGTAFLRIEGGRFETGNWELFDDGQITSKWPTIAQGKLLAHRYYRTGPGAYTNLETSSMRWSNFTIEPGDSRGLQT